MRKRSITRNNKLAASPNFNFFLDRIKQNPLQKMNANKTRRKVSGFSGLKVSTATMSGYKQLHL